MKIIHYTKIVFVFFFVSPVITVAQNANHISYFYRLTEAAAAISENEFERAIIIYSEADTMVHQNHDIHSLINAAKCAAIINDKNRVYYFVKRTVTEFNYIQCFEKDTLFEKYKKEKEWQNLKIQVIKGESTFIPEYRRALDSLDVKDKFYRKKYKLRKTILLGFGSKQLLYKMRENDSLIHIAMDSLRDLYGYPEFKNVNASSNFFMCYWHRNSDSVFLYSVQYQALKDGIITPYHFILCYNYFKRIYNYDDKYMLNCNNYKLTDEQTDKINRNRKEVGYMSIENETKIRAYFSNKQKNIYNFSLSLF